VLLIVRETDENGDGRIVGLMSTSHDTRDLVMSHMNESCHTGISHVTRVADKDGDCRGDLFKWVAFEFFMSRT